MKSIDHYKDGIEQLEAAIASFEKAVDCKEFDGRHFDSAEALKELRPIHDKLLFGE